MLFRSLSDFSSPRPELQSAPVTALLSLPRARKRERLDEPYEATTDMKKIAAVAVASFAADAGSAGRSANAQRDANGLAEDTHVDAASTGLPGGSEPVCSVKIILKHLRGK